MDGVGFYLNLLTELNGGDNLGQYAFVAWRPNGGLQFRINENQRKTIPAEIIIAAYHVSIEREEPIDQHWLETNGHTDYCFVPVLNHLLVNFPLYPLS